MCATAKTNLQNKETGMKNSLMSKLKGLGKSLLQAIASGLVAWLATITSGCTTVVVPTDESNVPAVTLTGALPIAVQYNGKSDNK